MDFLHTPNCLHRVVRVYRLLNKITGRMRLGEIASCWECHHPSVLTILPFTVVSMPVRILCVERFGIPPLVTFLTFRNAAQSFSPRCERCNKPVCRSANKNRRESFAAIFVSRSRFSRHPEAAFPGLRRRLFSIPEDSPSPGRRCKSHRRLWYSPVSQTVARLVRLQTSVPALC